MNWNKMKKEKTPSRNNNEKKLLLILNYMKTCKPGV